MILNQSLHGEKKKNQANQPKLNPNAFTLYRFEYLNISVSRIVSEWYVRVLDPISGEI